MENTNENTQLSTRERELSAQTRRDEARMKISTLGVKALLWFIALMVIGTILCVILAAAKIAVQTLLAVAGILAVLIVICIAIYYAIRYKYHADKYHHELRKLEQQDINSASDN